MRGLTSVSRRRHLLLCALLFALPSLSQTVSHSGVGPRDRTPVWQASPHHALQSHCPSQYLEAWPPATNVPVCDWNALNAQDYLAGKWVRLPERCRLRTRELLANFTYPYKQECNNPDHECGIGSDGCYDRLLKTSQWVWQPNTCQLMPFDAIKLSESLAGKRVHFLGDSTTRQQFWALGGLMQKGGVVSLKAPAMRFTTVHNATFSVDGFEFLTGDRSDPGDLTFNSTSGSVWIGEAVSADYLVFNTGFHHHRRDIEFKHYQSVVRAVMATLKKSFTGSRIFFSTTRTAHEFCGLNPVPLDSYSLSDGLFHWAAPHRNEYRWIQEAEALGLTNFHLLNSSMDTLRGDSHVTWQKKRDGTVFDDCLHQCYPGVPDYINWLVMHALVQAESQEVAAVATMEAATEAELEAALEARSEAAEETATEHRKTAVPGFSFADVPDQMWDGGDLL